MTALPPYTVTAGRVVATFLGPQDVPWLARLLDEARALAGRPEFVARERFRRPLPGAPSAAVWQLAVDLLLRRLRAPLPPVPPRAVRGRLCAARAAWPDAPRDRLVVDVAAALAVAPAEVEAAFVADLPGERAVAAPHADLTATALVAAVNLAVAQAVLRRAVSLAIEAEEGVRTIVRVARLCGLICAVPEPAPTRAPAVLVSGPLAVLTRTTAYGRAFASLLPRLPWCGRYRLRARCLVGGREASFELTSSDALLPAPPPRAFDSRLEERFARDLLRLAPDWDVVREPAAFRAGGALLFPDFAIRPRAACAASDADTNADAGADADVDADADADADASTEAAARVEDAPAAPSPSRATDATVFVEIVGFWTAAYLARKLERLRAARVDRLVLCVDEACRCDEPRGAGLPENIRVVPFRRDRVDAAAVLRAARTLLEL